MASAGTAYVEIKGDLKPLDRELRGALSPAKMGKLGRTGGTAISGGMSTGAHKSVRAFDQANTKIGTSFKGLAKRALAAGAAFGGGFAAVAGVKDAIATTQELVGSTRILAQVTGLSTKEASKWAEVANVRNLEGKTLNQGFLTLSKNINTATDATAKAQPDMEKLFGTLGVGAKELKGGKTGDIVLKLADAFQKLPAGAQKAALAQKLFGRQSQNLLPLLNAGSEGLKEQLGLADKYGVTMDKSAVKKALEAAAAQRELSIAMDGVKIAFAQNVLPILAKGAGAIANFIAQIRSGEGAGGRFAKIFEGIGKALGPPLKAVGGFIKDFVEEIVKGEGAGGRFRDVAVAIGKVVGKIGSAFGELPTPIKIASAAIAGLGIALTVGLGPVGIAIAAIAAGAYLVAKNWDTIKKAVETAIAAVGNALGIGKSDVQGFGQAVSNIIHGVVVSLGVLKTVFTPIFNVWLAIVKRVMPALKQIIGGTLQVIGGMIKVFTGIFTGDFGKAWEGVKQIFSGAARAILGTLRAFTAPMREIVSRAAGVITAPFRAAWGLVKTIFSGGIAAALGVIRGAVGRFKDVGEKIGGAISGGIRGGIKGLASVGKAIMNGVIAVMNRAIAAINKVTPGKIKLKFAPDIPGIPDIPTIDPLARGGRVKTAMTLVGEEGPELVRLPVGSRVYSHPQSKVMAKDMGIQAFARGGVVKKRDDEYESLPLPKRKPQRALRAAAGKVDPSLVGQVWSALQGRIPKAARFKPRFKITEDPRGDEQQTYVGAPSKNLPRATRGQIWFPRWAWNDIFGGADGPDYTRWAKTALVHEHVHGVQSLDTLKTRRKAEGGAVLFSEKIVDSIMGPGSLYSASGQYRSWANQMLQGRGEDWYMHDQFLPDSSPGTKGKQKAKKQRGGASQVKASSLQPAASYLAKLMREKFGLSVSSGERAGDTGSFHSQGKAVDLVGSKMREGAEWVKSSGLYKTLLEGIHNPNLSTDSGKLVPAGFWGAKTWADHKDHIHLAATSISEAAKRGLDEKGGAKKGPKKLTGGRLSLGQIVTLAKQAGFPDPALAAAIAFAESKHGQIRAHNTDGEDSRGLWQINVAPGANPSYAKRNLFDARVNAKAAFEISKGGKDWTPWSMYTNKGYKPFLGGKAKALPNAKGGVDGGNKNSLADYLAFRLEEAEATDNIQGDDLRWINKGLRYWRGVLRRSKKAGNSTRASEALTHVVSLRDKKVALREPPPDSLFELGGLSSLNAGTVPWNISSLKPQLERLQLEIAQAGLTERLDANGEVTPDSYTDDINAATGLQDFWKNIYDLTLGKVDLGVQARDTSGTKGVKKLGDGRYAIKIKGKDHIFEGTPGQTVTVAKKKVTIPGGPETEKRPGTVRGTVGQQIEAAGELKSAKDALKSLQDEIRSETGTTAPEGDSRIADLIRQQLEAAQKELAIAKAQIPIFERFAKAPKFAGGGIMPGAGRTDQPAWVTPREGVFTEEQMKAMGGPQAITVLVEDGAVDPNKIRVVVNEEVGSMVRKARSGGPAVGRRYVMPR